MIGLLDTSVLASTDHTVGRAIFRVEMPRVVIARPV